MLSWSNTIVLLLATASHSIFAFNLENSVNGDFFLDYSLQQLIETKVTVASLSEEKISETPVPVSLITSQMIYNSGALTLKELLLMYVPGFTHVEDQNEINIASRGIFTSSQQKILILINGHRLNNRSYSMASPDHSISLHKVKQIEVLRGPSSSIYGNVSLTATINIILKTAADIEQNQVSALVGDHQQKGASFLYANDSNDTDLIIWGQVYRADGESIDIPENMVYSPYPQTKSTAIIYGIKDKSPYDVGFNFKTSYGEFLVNQRRGHYIEPFTAAGLSGEPYPYERFEKINGYGPGIGYTTTHLDYKHRFAISDWQNETRIYWDNYHTESALVIDPVPPVFGAPQWKDISAGVLSTFERKVGKSDLLLGIQFEGYKVYGSEFPLGVGSYQVTTSNDNMLPAGKESNYSGFIQYKHSLNNNWQTNLGMRYDYKNRKKTKNIDQLSPRLGLIYYNENTSVKFSYSEAFVDATYWNRFSNLSSFKGASTLKPEKLRTLQISPTITLPQYNLQLATNLFFDQAKNVIYRDNSATTNNYSNSGKLNTWGLEQEIGYISPEITIRFNATYRRATSSEKIAIDNGYINNIPKLSSNLIIEKSINERLGLHLNLRYIGRQYSPIVIQQDGVRIADPYPNEGVSFYQPNNFEDHALLVNGNVSYKFSEHLSVNLRIENMLDKSHKQGGSTLHPYPQKGRWFNLKATYSF